MLYLRKKNIELGMKFLISVTYETIMKVSRLQIHRVKLISKSSKTTHKMPETIRANIEEQEAPGDGPTR